MTVALLCNHWVEVRRDCRGYWGKLTDEDLDRIDGQFDRFVRALRTRYGFSQLQAEDELEGFLFRYSDAPSLRPGVALAEARL
jgi:uncharacterized protein YjbJ (UPF0337 family)